jgi:hypothetical protein
MQAKVVHRSALREGGLPVPDASYGWQANSSVREQIS